MAGLDEARAYMAKREIPQLFESLMTALMYKKPDDHIKFLEDCLNKAQNERRINWHTFIEPLPPIPKTSDKIHVESVQNDSYSPSPVLKKPNPLPPIQKTMEESTPEHDEELNTKSSDVNSSKIEKIGSIDDDRGLEEKGLANEAITATDLDDESSVNIGNEIKNEEKIITAPIIFVLEHHFLLHTMESLSAQKIPLTGNWPYGGPGCGKGTQCQKIVAEYGYAHLSAGDLLREETSKGTETGKMIDEIIKDGQLVPQEVTIKLLQGAMRNLVDSKGFLIDGFPREISQGVQFEQEVKECQGLIMFECSDEILVDRLLKRAETSGRTDDNEDTIKKRLALFHGKTIPVIEHYGKKVKLIDASGSIDEVFQNVKSYMNELTEGQEDLNDLIGAVAVMETAKRQALEEAEDQEDLNDLIDAVAAMDAAKMSALEEDEDNDFVTSKDSDASPTIAGVTEEVITAEIETKLGNRGVTSNFAKEVLNGKEIIFVIGGPGCGKGTQCELIVNKYGHKHMSIGDLLRKEIASGSDMGNTLSECMKNGELVSINLVMRVIMEAMVADESASKFLIDGFPRELKQAKEFEEEIGDCSRVLYFHCPPEVMLERLKKRAEHSGRADDNEETIKNRLIVFDKEITPIIEHFQSKGILSQIEAVSTPEDIFSEVCKELEKLTSVEERMDPKELLKDTNIVFVLGGPGSGKGTQCERIVAKYGFCHLSTGDLLRDEVNSGSKRAEALKAIMEKGELVSQNTILELLKEAMLKNKSAKGFLIDGFPRDVPQGEKFEKQIGTCKFILYFECSNDCMVERLLGRAKTSGRVDDNEETIKKRLKTFEDQTLPVLDVYGKQEKVRKISAERSIDEIFNDVCVALDVLS